jgi:uncharacterized protein involved in outer membrane biogenesis
VKTDKKMTIDIKFTSPHIQIDDFLFDNWSWSAEDQAEQTVGQPIRDDKQSENSRNIFSPSVLKKFNAVLTVQSEKVLSGDDELGSGMLSAKLYNGRIAVDPLEIHLPSGSITMSASLKPGSEQSRGSIKAKIHNFDIGILARRNKPDTKMEGFVNLEMDLQSTAASFDQILENGNGYFDFSGQLKNLNAGVIDLWAVNLIASIVSSTNENKSHINCAVGRWSVNNGLLTPDIFFIDTSRIRICGEGQVDLGKQKIDLVIDPPSDRNFLTSPRHLKFMGLFLTST